MFPPAVLSLENEGRALWIIRTTLASKSSIDRAIEYAVEGGFRILFVQAVGRGDAFYPSSILPVSEFLDDDIDFDPFGYFLDQAHKNGLEVHVWVNLLYVWSSPRMPEYPVHIVRRHPDWMVERSNGPLAGDASRDSFPGNRDQDLFLSPALPEVREFLVKVISEIIGKYPVDGLHLDYIRYPSGDSGFEPYARRAFFSRYLVDPVDLFEQEKDADPLLDRHSYMRLRTEWQRWRARQVTELLREIRRVQKEESPNMLLSAAVVPSVRRAHDIYGQDWGMWINKGLLDIVVTMSYSHDREVVLAQARAARKVVRHGLLYVGVAVYNQSLDSAVKCVRELRKLDVDGFSVFSYNSMLEHPEGFKTFRKTVLEAPSSTSRTR